jgi:hypothetical protein
MLVSLEIEIDEGAADEAEVRLASRLHPPFSLTHTLAHTHSHTHTHTRTHAHTHTHYSTRHHTHALLVLP